MAEEKAKLHFTKSGEPFANRRAATLHMGLLRKKGTESKIVEVEGGFALEVLPEDYHRPARPPINTRNVLTAPHRKGYVRRYVNDTSDRIEMFLNRGWEIVTDKDLEVGDPRAGKASSIGTPVTKNVGLGVTAVLMEMKKELYDELMAERNQRINQQEKIMLRQGEAEGTYGNVQIGTKGRL